MASRALPRGLVAFAAGLLFSLGLGVSQMTDPARVLAFLDVAGDWDPSLALVMVGAILTYGALARGVLRRAEPLLGGRFVLPRTERVSARTLCGAAIFGVGWGLAGYCPGPAFASLAGPAAGSAAITLICIAAGGLIAEQWMARSARDDGSAPASCGEIA